jgi:hypothetical protein
MIPALVWCAGLAVVWLLVMAGLARGETIYVDSRLGDDRYDGQSTTPISEYTGPVRSLQRAVQLASHGDTIELADGGATYFGSLTLWGDQHSGEAQAPFQIIGNGAVLSGARPIPDGEWSHVCSDVWRITPIRKGWYQLVLDGQAVPETACERTAPELPEIPVGQWCAWRGAVYYQAERGIDPNTMSFSLADEEVGITLLDVHNVVISGLTLRHFRLDGMNAHDRCRDVLLENIISEENGRAGIAVAGTSQVTIVAGKLQRNRRYSLLITELGAAAVENSELDVDPAVISN